MTDDDQDPTPGTDQPVEPSAATEETTLAPETPSEVPAETPEKEIPEPAGEPEPDRASPEFKYWQGAFTQARQKDREEIEELKSKVAGIESSREVRPPTEEPEDPQVNRLSDYILRSKAYRELEDRHKRTEATLASIQSTVVASALERKHPEIAGAGDSFIEWLVQRPGIGTEVQAGRMSIQAAISAFRVETPVKGRAAKTTPAAVKKPIPKVEGPSGPAGTPRDIRAIAKQKGIDPFSVAYEEAKRETRLASNE